MNGQTEVADEVPSTDTSSKEVIEVEKPMKSSPSEPVEADINETVEPAQKRRKLSKKERYIQRKEERREKRKAVKMRRRARRAEKAASAAAAKDISPRAPPPPPRVSMAESKCKTRVVLDCAYDHLMSLKDTCKLAHQIAYCYSTNRHLPAPVQLYITGLGSAFEIKEGTEQPAELREPKEQSTLARLRRIGAQNWDIHLKMVICAISFVTNQFHLYPSPIFVVHSNHATSKELCLEDYRELFPASSIVYLCAESKNDLPDTFVPTFTCTGATAADPPDGSATTAIEDISSPTNTTPPVFTVDDVYVIGGLVDHNHHQGLCYKQALQRGHRTAKLPLERAGVTVEGRRVLSLVHVFQALAFVLSGAHPQWHDALHAALPPRKCKS
ncbi:unnamed protein product [Hydatigera taeniaeformis]|uniref:tRNA (guanine(9)-N(1))-methyltransferase n=1 Tax=Hydatigena taeniaeformis TaxID=6205 RepID=A0A0R3WKQ1_HYDTA|nr:unnamed protein product [Hydatigera taeniaeformis]